MEKKLGTPSPTTCTQERGTSRFVRVKKKKPSGPDLPNWKDEPPATQRTRSLTRTVTQPKTPETLENNLPGRGHVNTKKPNCGFGHVATETLRCAFACRTQQRIERRTTTIENGAVQNRKDRSNDMVQQESDRMPETESPQANALTKTMFSHLRPIDNATTSSDKGAPHVQWERCSAKHKLSVKQRRASHMATLATSAKPQSPNTINLHEGTDRRLNENAKLVDTKRTMKTSFDRLRKTRGILLLKSSVNHLPQTTTRVAHPVSNFKIFFQQKQNFQTQRYTSTQDNEDIKTKICERAPLGIQPSTMNVARRSTHNPRAQHQTCVPLHVRHGGPRTFSDRDILVEDHGVCTVRKTTRTTCVQEINTNWDLHRGNKSFIRRVDSTQGAF